MKEHHRVGLFALTIAAFCIAGIAQAQTAPPWDSNTIRWVAPTACSNGRPIAECPVSGYIVERSPTSSGPFANLASVAANVVTYTHTGAAAGVNCYRTIVTAAPPLANALPSNIACRTNAPPVSPNPATDLHFVVPVIAGANTAPVFRIRPDGSKASDVVVGFANVGAPCGTDRRFRYRGKNYFTPATWRPWESPSTLTVAAPCAPRA